MGVMVAVVMTVMIVMLLLVMVVKAVTSERIEIITSIPSPPKQRLAGWYGRGRDMCQQTLVPHKKKARKGKKDLRKREEQGEGGLWRITRQVRSRYRAR